MQFVVSIWEGDQPARGTTTHLVNRDEAPGFGQYGLRFGEQRMHNVEMAIMIANMTCLNAEAMPPESCRK
jgi:hypothetical protein